MKWLSDKWKQWSEFGIRLPFAHDPTTEKPSVTLLFPYVTFVVAVISTICLHFWPSMLMATATSIMFWIVAVVLYLLRKISRATFNLKDKSIGLDSEENQ